MNWLFWLILVIILSFIEVTTVNLLTIWFVLSGIVTIIISFLTNDIIIETTIFIILGIFLLITTRPIFKKYIKGKDTRTNLDQVIGMQGVVSEDIKKGSIGEVKVAGKKWSAISDEEIKVGEYVIIEEIKGVKLVVKKEGKEK